MIHVDIKKLAAIPDGGGWRMHGRGNDAHGGHSGAGYVFVHSAIDDGTRIVYSEIHRDEQATTAAGFWTRAAAWYASIGIECERVITDNGPCYKS
ncbi:MAG: DDE-type integrase/transposase/recombinase, partial [Acidimicrobiia bacterium]|nr:DDE-type integrase/transposase/recombinase [Acidimicrobiia bacterium]